MIKIHESIMNVFNMSHFSYIINIVLIKDLGWNILYALIKNVKIDAIPCMKYLASSLHKRAH